MSSVESPNLFLESLGETSIYNEEDHEDYQEYIQPRLIGDVLKICQINVEGLTINKSEFLGRFLHKHNCDVLLLQETHVINSENLPSVGNILNCICVDSINPRYHGIATYVSIKIVNKCISVSKIAEENLEILVTKIDCLYISNIYKPPTACWSQPIQCFSYPSVYMGDFNSHHNLWGYRSNDANGEFIVDWALNNQLHLMFDAKDLPTFHSGRWNTGTNPDLCFVSLDEYNNSLPSWRSVSKAFPNSQHRPVFLEIGIQIPVVNSLPVPRWNFRKANWSAYAKMVDMNIRWIPPIAECNNRLVGVIIAAAKKCIPRGYRKTFIPSWSPECEDLWILFNESGSMEVGANLLSTLNKERKKRWVELVQEMDFSHSSRRAWDLLKKLGGSNGKSESARNINPNKIASRLLLNSKVPVSRNYSKNVKSSFKRLRKSLCSSPYGGPVSIEEVDIAISQLKRGKAAGCDAMFPEFFIHMGKNAKNWLAKFFSSCYLTGKIPNAWKKANVRAVLKPGKDKTLPENYRPISLLCVGYKLLEKIIYNRIVDVVNKSVPVEQAGFRAARNCCDQVLALTTMIEAGFQDKLKTTVVFMDLSAAYDTVWKRGLLYKLAKILKCKNTINLIVDMLSNRSFVLFLGNMKSRRRLLRNGLPQGSVLAPLFFNVYISDLPTTISRKFCYADDMALAIQYAYHPEKEEEAIQKISNDLSVLNDYYSSWRLRPNPRKCEVLTFHLSNSTANCEVNISFQGIQIPYNLKAKYLGVTLDRSLTFKYHCQTLKDKLKSRNNIIQKLAGSCWGASAHVLRISALALVYSAAEYCAPVWSHSTHSRMVDIQLNTSMRLISGTIKSTQLPWLPVLSNIAPPSLRRNAALAKEVCKIFLNDALPIHIDLTNRSNASNRLVSRCPLWSKIEDLGDFENYSINDHWQRSFDESDIFNKNLIYTPFEEVPGFHETRRRWATLNRIRTCAGRTNYTLHQWAPDVYSPICDCGYPFQTVEHIVNDCPLRRFEGGLEELHLLSESAISWIDRLDISL